MTLARATLTTAALLVVPLLAACAGPGRSAPSQPTISRVSATTGTSAAASTGATTPTPLTPVPTASAAPLRAVDWSNVVIPASVCGAGQPIQLSNGQAVVGSTHWPDFPHVHVTLGPVQYGDLGSDGHQAAAVNIWCDNGGGTADGQLADTWVIFAGDATGPRVIAALTPQQPRNPNTPHVPYFDGQLQILPGRVITHELWYGPDDGTCCPSVHATTVWTYRDASLQVTATTIDTHPSP